MNPRLIISFFLLFAFACNENPSEEQKQIVRIATVRGIFPFINGNNDQYYDKKPNDVLLTDADFNKIRERKDIIKTSIYFSKNYRKGLSNLSNIRSLIAMHPNKMYLADIGKMKQLENLRIEGQSYSSVSFCSGNLPALTHLGFILTEIDTLDLGKNNLSQLRSLSFSKCKISYISNNFSKLKSLRILKLYYCNLITLPESISEMNLDTLLLQGTPKPINLEKIRIKKIIELK